MKHERQISDAIQRSLGRARAVETPEHLPDAARDAHLLAAELQTLRQRVAVQERFIRDVKRTAREWSR